MADDEMLIPEKESLVDLLLRRVNTDRDKVAIIHRGRKLQYGELWQAIQSLAFRLEEGEGVRRGTRVLLYMDNCVEYVVAYYALAYLSAVSVPLNTGLKEGQLLDLARHADSTLLLHCGGKKALQNSATDLEGMGLRLWNLAELPSQQADVEAPRPRYRPHDLSSIVYTSGTTGRPKGVMLSGHNLYSNTLAIIRYLGLNENDRGLCVLPFYYVYGNSVLHTHLAVGATLVLEDNLLYPQQLLDRMAREQVTGFAGVPSTFRLLLNRCDLQSCKLPHLRYLTQAGGPLAPADIEKILTAWPAAKFYVMYGQTEATARLSYLPPERLSEKLGSVGIPVPGVSLKIFDDHGDEKPAGEVGEICASGPNIMLGYWRDPEATRNKMFGKWLRTGDLGYMDSEGYITIVGRNSDQIKTGDHRVAPEEIEQVIIGCYGVEEVAVVGVPDSLLGQVLKACIVPRPGVALERRDILRYCSERLAAYKLPKVIEMVDALPKTASGKIQRYLLQNPEESATQRALM